MHSEPLKLSSVRIRDGFWGRLTSLAREVIIPYQWEVMNDRVKGVKPSGVVRNFRIVAGKTTGRFTGCWFQDSDLGKWIEAVAYRLTTHPDKALERKADRAIDLVSEAQDDDGYLNTYYSIHDPKESRWTNLYKCHELYVAGHLLEGAVAYYEATGKRKFLDVMIRNMEHIAGRLGRGDRRRSGYDGHPEIELALVKLYRLTGEERYLRLASRLIDARGTKPFYFEREARARGEKREPTVFKLENRLAHLPVREQTEAVGHAVRAMYLYCGMADVAAETGDRSLVEPLRSLWRSVADRRMYITGGIGSDPGSEAFTFDYDLPNERSCSETCAVIGLVFWAQRMLRLDADGEYADVMERALYNNVPAGVSLDGKHFFYTNALASQPHPRRPGSKLRPGWHSCACCPPNLARLITSLGRYVYGQSDDGLFVHLFADSEASFEIGSKQVRLVLKTAYPWDENVAIEVEPDGACRFPLAVRIPGWCRKPKLSINGSPALLAKKVCKGYAVIERTWKPGDRLDLVLPMPVERVYSHAGTREDVGRVALQRGPVVYCIEEADNGADLNAIELPREAPLKVKPGRLGEVSVPCIHAPAVRLKSRGEAALCADSPRPGKTRLVAVPYYLWANRGEGEMLVWMREGR